MVDTIKFSQMTNAGNINNNDIMPSLRSGENVILNNPWTFLPPGDTASRPAPSSTINYRLRFNTEDQLYEYYDAVLGAWTQLQESAFTVGPFITYTADASLPDAQNLGALANGILKQTITIGVATLNIAVLGTDYYGPGFVIPGTDGGTGVNNGALTINLGSATTGFVLTSDSSGNATWQSVSLSGAITSINGDTGTATPVSGVVTISGASTGLTFAGSSATLLLGGLLNSTFGGTGVDAPTAHGIMVAEGASPMTPIVLSSGQILIGSTGADPVAAAISSGTGILVGNGAGSITVSLAAIASHDILSNITGGSAAPIANTLTATIDAAIGSTQGNVLYRNATGWVVLAPGSSGQFLTSGGPAANVSWSSQVAPSGQALTEVNDTNVTMTLGGSPTTALLAATSMTLGWTGQLSIGRGGTGVASVTIAPTASAWAGWDANKNFSANNFLPGFSSTATAGGTTTLTVASPYSNLFTGTLNQTVVLPVTSTLVLGFPFYIFNASSGTLTVQSSGGNTVQVMSPGTSLYLTAVNTGVTTAAGWNAEYAFNGGSGSGTVNSGTINQLAWYAASGTAVSGLATANNGVLVTSAGGVPSISTTLPSGLTITNPVMIGDLFDVNGNILVQLSTTPSAVNYVQLQNTITGIGPTVAGNGSDTNIQLLLKGKGTGGVGLQAYTDGSSASIGYVGEVINATITFASNTPYSSSSSVVNLTSISLTAGDWDVYGSLGINATSTVTNLQGGISTTSGTLPNFEFRTVAYPIATATIVSDAVPSTFLRLAATTTVYLVLFGVFTGTCIMFGNIYARRRR